MNSLVFDVFRKDKVVIKACDYPEDGDDGIEMDPEFEFTFSYLLENFGNATLAFWVGGLITSVITAVIGYYSIIAIYKYKAVKRVRRWK